jgi:hypothetical protein
MQTMKVGRLFVSPYFAVAFCHVIAIPLFFFRGFGVFDDSVYLRIGELILQGYLPYRDVFDNKPPGIYVLASLISWLGHDHWLAPRVFLYLFSIGFSCLVVGFVGRNWGRLAAVFAGWTFCLSYILAQGYSYHTDQFCAFFGFVGTVMGVRAALDRKGAAWLATVGFCFGISVLFRQTGLLYVAAFLLWSCAWEIGGRRKLAGWLAKSALIVAGLALPLVACVILLAGAGILRDFTEAVFFSLPTSLPASFFGAIKLWAKGPVLLFLVVACGAALVLWSRSSSEMRATAGDPLLQALALVGLAALLPTFKLYSNTHYLGAAVPFLAVVGSVLASKCMGFSSLPPVGLFAKRRALIAAPFVLVIAAYAAATTYGSYLVVSQRRIFHDLAQMREINEILDRKLPRDAKVFCLADNPARLYYMADRLPASKFIYFYGAGWMNEEMMSLEAGLDALGAGKFDAVIAEFPVLGRADFTTDDAGTRPIHAAYKSFHLKSEWHPVHKTTTRIFLR